VTAFFIPSSLGVDPKASNAIYREQAIIDRKFYRLEPQQSF
jgi:hypothetical protein